MQNVDVTVLGPVASLVIRQTVPADADWILLALNAGNVHLRGTSNQLLYIILSLHISFPYFLTASAFIFWSTWLFFFRYNYPRCEECNCNPDGVTATFFQDGGCDSVPEGTLCTCKERVTGRICDTCKPLFWSLEASNDEGCRGTYIIFPAYLSSLIM